MGNMMNVTRNDIYNEEEDLLQYWKLLVDAWREVPKEYTKLMSYLGELFNSKFENYAPLPIVGDLWGSTSKIFVVNPLPPVTLTKEYISFEEIGSEQSEKERKRGQDPWANQLMFGITYFRSLGKNNLEIEYYTKLDQLVKYYEQTASKNQLLYQVLQKKVIQANVVPFYGESLNLAIKKTNEFIEGSFKRILKYYLSNDFDIMIITDKNLFETMLSSNIIKKGEEISNSNSNSFMDEFNIEINGLKQKGLAITSLITLSNDQLKVIARGARKIASWNRENFWKNNF